MMDRGYVIDGPTRLGGPRALWRRRGLLWSLITELSAWQLQLFFLGCVVIAGIYGGITSSRRIIWVQALPAMIALILVFLAQSPY